MDNVLLLGNGFSRQVFDGIPSWRELLDSCIFPSLENCTILYEAHFLESEKNDESSIKEKLVKDLRSSISTKKIRVTADSLYSFGHLLKDHNIHNIITTNYDDGIELLLSEFCGYTEQKNQLNSKETIYSIRTHKEYINEAMHHDVKIWKIHGSLDRTKSIMLGYDHYCGSVAKLTEYIKGRYKSDTGPSCKTNILDKCISHSFDAISWAELFFNSNVYIIGFGMSFSELDLWWITNKRARINKELKSKTGTSLTNQIYWLYNPQYDQKEEILASLQAFGVQTLPFLTGENYIESIFNRIDYINRGDIGRSWPDLSGKEKSE